MSPLTARSLDRRALSSERIEKSAARRGRGAMQIASREKRVDPWSRLESTWNHQREAAREF